MAISYFVDISKGYLPNFKKHKVLSGKCHGFNSPRGLHSLAEGG